MKSINRLISQRILSFILIIVLSTFLFSCGEDDELGNYYEGNFNDLIKIVSQSDTTNIIIEQLRMNSIFKDDIPYSEEIVNANTDSINLKLFVSFGSYNQTPNVIKETNNILDTFYVWYSTRIKINKSLSKNNSITGVTTSPKLDYVSIDSVVVQRGQNKFINLITRLVQ